MSERKEETRVSRKKRDDEKPAAKTGVNEQERD